MKDMNKAFHTFDRNTIIQDLKTFVLITVTPQTDTLENETYQHFHPSTVDETTTSSSIRRH